MDLPNQIYSRYSELYTAHNNVRLILGDQVFNDRRLLKNLNKIYNYIIEVTDEYAESYLDVLKEENIDAGEYLISITKEISEDDDLLVRTTFIISALYILHEEGISNGKVAKIVKNLIDALYARYLFEENEQLKGGIPIRLEKIVIFIDELEEIPSCLLPSIAKICEILVDEDDPVDIYTDHIIKAISLLLRLKKSNSKKELEKLSTHRLNVIKEAALNALKYY